MRNLPFERLCFCVSIAVLAGCGGGLSPAPSGSASRVTPLTAAQNAKAQALLYISDLGANAVDVYTYPQGDSVTSFTGFGSVAGLCSDKAGDVFVVDEAGPVDVYKHGATTPIRKLATTGAPYGCSVDPVTGDLALTQLSAFSDGAIAIYPKAKGKPRIVHDSYVDATWFCGYDGKGNLFADAWDRSGNLVLVELAKGGKSLKMFKVGEKFANPGGTMWDGSYVAIANRGDGVVYRSSETGHVAHTVTLKSGGDVQQFWIDGSTLIGPNEENPSTVGFWHYPGGGAPFKTLKGFYTPFGATVSVTR
jgi:hypothetical protein